MNSHESQQLGTFLASLRSSTKLSQEEVATLVGSKRSSLSRLETGESILPAKGPTRKLVIDLAEILCTSRAEIERCLKLAQIDSSFLTETEQLQLGLFHFHPFTDGLLADDLKHLVQMLDDHVQELAAREQKFGVIRTPPSFKSKLQTHKNLLQEIQNRLQIRYNDEDLLASSKTTYVTVTSLEGKIVVGFQYGDVVHFPLPHNLYSLASEHALQLMQQADLERFAVDDCVLVTNSRNFAGWNPGDITTTVVDIPLPLPEDLERIRQEKLPVIRPDYFNSSHYRLVSCTPSFSDFEQLGITLAPIGFHDYYSLTPFFDEPLLTAADGSPVSIRQKYGNTALMYSATEQGRSLIPTPVSIQCVVVTGDNQILLMKRSPSVAFYPDHWSASFEETMNAPGHNRKGQPSKSDDADFFAGAVRGLDEEFAIPASAIESIKALSLNVEYLTLSLDVIMVLRIASTSKDVRQSWLLKAADRDEAAKLDLLPATLEAVIAKLFSKNLWHPTARMRLIQYLFHTYGVDDVASAIQATLSQ